MSDGDTTLATLTAALRQGAGRRDLMRYLRNAGMAAALADGMLVAGRDGAGADPAAGRRAAGGHAVGLHRRHAGPEPAGR